MRAAGALRDRAPGSARRDRHVPGLSDLRPGRVREPVGVPLHRPVAVGVRGGLRHRVWCRDARVTAAPGGGGPGVGLLPVETLCWVGFSLSYGGSCRRSPNGPGTAAPVAGARTGPEAGLTHARTGVGIVSVPVTARPARPRPDRRRRPVRRTRPPGRRGRSGRRRPRAGARCGCPSDGRGRSPPRAGRRAARAP